MKREKVIAAELFRFCPCSASSSRLLEASYVITTPDARVRVAHSVVFVPDKGESVNPDDPKYAEILETTGLTNLRVVGRVSGDEQGGQLVPVEYLIGTHAAGQPLEGGVFGWIVETQHSHKDIRGRLICNAPTSRPLGRWCVVGRATPQVEMTDDEWNRVRDRIECRPDVVAWSVANGQSIA